MTEDSGPRELGFEPKLFTNATHKKAVAVAELYKQLKRLSKELNGLEQETVDTQSLDGVTKQLVAPALLRHKEPGVVAYVSCCIADVLRLYAPEAPYTDDEIKQIFSVFIDQLQLLGDSDSQFSPLREYLLTSLATVRTPALVAMQPDAEEIISRFFTVLFGVVGGSQAHSIQMQILDVLQQLVEEPKAVPQDVIDVILLQFTKRRQQDNPAAHQLAGDLATATADILQKYIYQYFNDVIVSAAQNREAGGSLDDLRAAHNLILELNRAAPGTLLNVVPQLEEELGVEDVDVRVLATGVVGQMLADKGFTLSKRYDSTWKAWKSRRADAAAAVRVQWAECAVALYQHQPQLARELNDGIAEKLRDVDERVRQAACRALGLLEMGAAVRAAIAEQVVAALGERCRDRKAAVRSEAIVALATLYGQVHEDVEQGDAAACQKWGGIPSTIFSLRYVNDPDVDSKVESILTGAILGFARIKDDRTKCRRLLTVFAGLTPKAQSGFFGYMRRQRDIIRLADLFLEICSDRSAEPANGDGDVEQRLQQLGARIAACFPDKARMETALGQLAGLHDDEIYQGLRATMDAKSDIKTVRRCQKSALKRLAALAPSLLDATAPLWKCVGLTTINRILVPFLIEHTAAGDQLRGAADALLAYVADVFPDILRLSGAELFDASGLQSRNTTAVEERLALMVKFAKAVPSSIPSGMEDQLAALVRAGSVRQAKYAAFLLTQAEGAAGLCAELAAELVDGLDSPGRRAPACAALSRLALHAPTAFAPHADHVVRSLVPVVLAGDMGGDGDEEWQPREALDDAAQARVHAVKVLANWLVGMDAKALTRDAAQTVLGALRQVVRGGAAAQRSASGLHV
ncbi:Sister chromatid cohesion protein pds5, partial [Coemansia helicoidea]